MAQQWCCCSKLRIVDKEKYFLYMYKIIKMLNGGDQIFTWIFWVIIERVYNMHTFFLVSKDYILQYIHISCAVEFPSKWILARNTPFVMYTWIWCFVYMRRHTWALMGPDSNKMLKPGFKSLYKYAGLVIYGNNR